jgi:hypothetical protein
LCAAHDRAQAGDDPQHLQAAEHPMSEPAADTQRCRAARKYLFKRGCCRRSGRNGWHAPSAAWTHSGSPSRMNAAQK